MWIVTMFLLIFAPFVWWCYILFKFKSLEKVPGPTRLPLIGNAFDIGRSPQDLFNNLCKFNKQYDGVFRIDMLNEVRLFISKPELIQQVLTSNFHITKSTAYDLLKPWLGIGLLTSAGKKWKVRRKMIVPTFYFKILDEFVKVFNSAGDILIRKLSEQVGNDRLNVYPYVNNYSLDVICETAMGIKVEAQEGHNSKYVNSVHDYLNIFITRIFSWQKFNSLFLFSPRYTDYANCLKILHKFTNDVITKRRMEKANAKCNGEPYEENRRKRSVALLDMLLESEDDNALSNEDLREEIDTFMFAGHDTTSSGISFAILALADNPQIQELVYQEVIQLLGDESNVSMQHLQNAKYLEMVIKEVLRMYPSVPDIERQLESDCMLGDYNCPKGTTISLFTYGLHHDPVNYPDPEKFDPDRFLPENQMARHTYSYIPFSAGPRNCIGQRFAMLQMKSTLMKIVKNFKILPIPNFEPDLGMSAILNSHNGIYVKLERRS